MAEGRTTVFADGLMDANIAHGVARMTLAQTGGDGKPMPVGQLVMPLVQLPAFVNGLTNLLKQIETRAREAQASAAVKAGAAAQEGAAAPAQNGGPAVPGAFRFDS